MAKSLNLADIQSLAASGAYGGQRSLSALSETTIRCAGVMLSDLDNWQGASHDLTQNEIDDIEAITAGLQYDVSNEVGISNMIKIAESVAISDVSSLSIDNFDSGVFHTFELVIQGMKSNDDVAWNDHVILQCNDDTDNEHYNSYGFYINASNMLFQDQIESLYGMYLPRVCATEYEESQSVGYVRMTFFAPQSDDYKIARAQGSVLQFTAGRAIQSDISCMWMSEDEITKMTISPIVGTTFVIDPDSAIAPSELRMTLYGLG